MRETFLIACIFRSSIFSKSSTNRLLFVATLAGIATCSLAANSVFSQDPFLENIRSTDPLTPEEELAALHVPPGFEIQLVASEPEVNKPLNMTFDSKGRLWVTDTVEYPYPVTDDRKGRDTIKILEDRDGDGAMETVSVFADGLNIPIGLYPYKNGCIVFSIPNIWWLEDTDGDNVADRREVLYGPMGWERDTHGLNNSFRRGYDGWLYACHGYNNNTSVAGADGHRITMNSGNTYRMQLDGQRIEQYTYGQVNPFGMAMDEYGRLFTADCHSKPIYELLPDGRYPSFGKPHDGLGFVEPMMDHLHGSTAIAGLAIWGDDTVPVEFRNNYFSGNVMTSRVNRDSVEWHGSTPTAIEEPDFVISDDPWFRPVEVRLGPDGALYIADFYNKIIGHYEVPLDHAGRDRERGRIFRVVYKGDAAHGSLRSLSDCDLSRKSTSELIEAFADPNLTLRVLAMHELFDSTTNANRDERVSLLREKFDSSSAPAQQACCLWLLFRLREPVEKMLDTALTSDSELLQVHAAKIMTAMKEWNDEDIRRAITEIADSSSHVKRELAAGFSQHDAIEKTNYLVQMVSATADDDPHLAYMLKRAVRRQLDPQDPTNGTGYDHLGEGKQVADHWEIISDVSLAVPNADSAAYLLNGLQSGKPVADSELNLVIQHIARYCPPESVEGLVEVAKARLGNNRLLQVQVLNSIRQSLAASGQNSSPVVEAWASELVSTLLDEAETNLGRWYHLPIPGKSSRENPWVLEQRKSSDGDEQSWFLSTLPTGEQNTGALRSAEFKAPDKLSFYCAGHIGNPAEPLLAQNAIRLIDAESGSVLIESRPPRNDVAQLIEWDLSESEGREVRVELVDGDQRGAYAWLSVGRFQPDVITVGDFSPRDLSAQITAALGLAANGLNDKQRVRLAGWLAKYKLDVATRAAISRALIQRLDDKRKLALIGLIEEPSVSEYQRKLAEQAVVALGRGTFESFAIERVLTYPASAQLAFVRDLLSTEGGAELLSTMLEKGQYDALIVRDSRVLEAIERSEHQQLKQQLEEWVASLPSVSEARDQFISQKSQLLEQMRGNSVAGADVFKQRCAACHQLAGSGAEVGPQLDGIGNRGQQRVLEDVLDPNRNVDNAFRTSTVITLDGRVLSGLLKREEGESLVLIDREGKEFRVQKDDVDQIEESKLSLMPEDVLKEVSDEEFANLFAFLLEQRVEREAK